MCIDKLLLIIPKYDPFVRLGKPILTIGLDTRTAGSYKYRSAPSNKHTNNWDSEISSTSGQWRQQCGMPSVCVSVRAGRKQEMFGLPDSLWETKRSTV